MRVEQWTVERHDDDEGGITYEVWEASKQRRICTAETRELARYIAHAPTEIAALTARVEGAERAWRSHRESAIHWEKLYRDAIGEKEPEAEDDIKF